MRPHQLHLTPSYGALSCASRSGDILTLDFLLKDGADVFARGDKRSQQAIHHAAEGGQVLTIRSLAAHGADLRAKDHYGWEAVHYAAANAQEPALRTLKALGANVRAKDDQGGEPVHLAARWGHMETLRILWQLGADLNARDANGLRPMDVAVTDKILEFIRATEKKAYDARVWLANMSEEDLKVMPTRSSAAKEGPPRLGPQYPHKGYHTVSGILHLVGEDPAGSSKALMERLLRYKREKLPDVLRQTARPQNAFRGAIPEAERQVLPGGQAATEVGRRAAARKMNQRSLRRSVSGGGSP